MAVATWLVSGVIATGVAPRIESHDRAERVERTIPASYLERHFDSAPGDPPTVLGRIAAVHLPTRSARTTIATPDRIRALLLRGVRIQSLRLPSVKRESSPGTRCGHDRAEQLLV